MITLRSYRWLGLFLLGISTTPTSLLAQQTSTSRMPVARRLWADADLADIGSASPDGRSFSFVDWTTGDLAIRDLVTGEMHHLTDKGPWSKSNDFAVGSVFSPDGRQLAYTWYAFDFSNARRGGAVKSEIQLRVMDVESRQTRVLFPSAQTCNACGYTQPTDWTRDQQFIVATGTSDDGTARIMLVPTAGGPPRIVKSFIDWRSPNAVKLSPDGKYIAYDYPPKKNEGRREIYVLPLQGGRETTLISHATSAGLVAWTDDGDVVFAEEHGGTPTLLRVRVEAGKAQGTPIVVKKDMWRSQPIQLTRAGRLYYTVASGDQEMYIATYDAAGKLVSRPVPISGRPGEQHDAPSWSLDGKYLAYVTKSRNQGIGAATLTIYSVDRGERRELRPPVANLGAVRWGSDGRSLLLRATDDHGRGALMRFDMKTGEVSQDPKLNSPGPRAFAPNGHVLYYSPSLDSVHPKRRIVARDLSSGNEREIFASQVAEEYMSLATSPDGRWLALSIGVRADAKVPRPETAPDTVKLIITPTTPGQARTVLTVSEDRRDARPTELLGFTGDGRFIFYSSAGSPVSATDGLYGAGHDLLWRISVDGGTPQRLEAPTKEFRTPRLSPDGRKLAFWSGKTTQELWVMEDPALGSHSAKTSSPRR